MKNHPESVAWREKMRTAYTTIRRPYAATEDRCRSRHPMPRIPALFRDLSVQTCLELQHALNLLFLLVRPVCEYRIARNFYAAVNTSALFSLR